MKKIIVIVSLLFLPLLVNASIYQENVDRAKIEVNNISQFDLDRTSERLIKEAIFYGKVNNLDKMEARITNLESLNRDLIQKLNTLQASTLSGSQIMPDTKTTLLEARISKLETTVNFIANSVTQVLAQVLKFLNK
ncbi:MAG: hypothetical protein NT155_04195 [Candidatus Staskawiczbacteria bacterium]|nr:hypothetical protein [Candidatus Staskawiczbacteria bacterium]